MASETSIENKIIISDIQQLLEKNNNKEENSKKKIKLGKQSIDGENHSDNTLKNSGNSKLYTLVFVKDSERLLLGKKRRGYKTGFYNGFGGKVEPNEKVDEAAKRELKEESNLDVSLEKLIYLGVVISVREEIDHIIHIFVVHWEDVNGIPEESDEMTPEWFEFHKKPLVIMDRDHKYWTEFMFDEWSFWAKFWYDKDEIVDMSVKTLQERPNCDENWYY